MDSVEALLDGWLVDGGSEVTASALSLELEVPIQLARKLLYAHLSKRLAAGASFRVFFAQSTGEGVKMQSAAVSSPLLPPVECLYGAKKTGGCDEGACEEDSQVQWQREIRALQTAFSAHGLADPKRSADEKADSVFVPSFATIRMPFLKTRKGSRSLVTPNGNGPSTAAPPVRRQEAALVPTKKQKAQTTTAFPTERTQRLSGPRSERPSISPKQRRLDNGPIPPRPTGTPREEASPAQPPKESSSASKAVVSAAEKPIPEKRALESCESPELRKKPKTHGPEQEAASVEGNIFADEPEEEETPQQPAREGEIASADFAPCQPSDSSRGASKQGSVDATVTFKEKVTGSRCFQEGNYLVFEDFQEVQRKTVPAASASPATTPKTQLQKTPSRPSSRVVDRKQKSITAFFSKK